jgi:signal transduction histidine kinase
MPDIVMGGLSLEIPLGTADRIFAAQLKKSILSFATFGILVLLSVMLLTLFLSKRISDVFRERERQRETLKNLNSRLSLLSARDQAILGSIVDGIAIISEEGIVENVNDAFTRCTGIEAETLRRKHISSFSGHPVLDAVFSSPAPGELNLRNRVFVLAEVPVYGADGNRLLCILRILHDATDEKLSAAMELAGTAAHEVRQPLAILMGISDMVREKARRGEDASEELEILGQQITRINDIISKMLKITKYRTKPYTEETRIFDLE